jgi:predicted GNAT family N-acyltransferase
LKINVKIITSENNLKIAFAIRKKVFVEEQKVPEDIEWDEFEYNANHVLAYIQDKPVGTARWRQTRKGVKLERFAVLPEFRSFGVGKNLVQFILNELMNSETIYLHAQEHVIKFYEYFGFVKKGSKFFEADIPHWLMELE